MAHLIPSPWSEKFDQLLEGAKSNLTLCSPFIGHEPCQRIGKRFDTALEKTYPQLFILTDLSPEKMMTGSTDVAALSQLVGQFPNTKIRMLPSLHAKIYLADDLQAIVTSANMTSNGLLHNFEYGVEFTDFHTVAKIKSDVVGYASLGSLVDQNQLEEFVSVIEELREARAAAERSERSRWQRAFDEKMDQATYTVLRARAAGRSPNAIFSDALLHLLRGGPNTTEQLNTLVQQIHPDLCDDRIDLEINGGRFGKKWKHTVRNAQQSLKQKGKIERRDIYWELRG